MKRHIALVLLAAMSCHCLARELASGLQVYIPVISERFDWATNYGGNDGLYGLENYTHSTPNTAGITYSDYKPGYQCIELGTKSDIGEISIYCNKKDSYFYTFRLMPFNNEKFHYCIDGSSNGMPPVSKPSFARGKTNNESIIKISGKDKDNSYSHNFYIDDIFIYGLSKNIPDLENAERMIVTGTLTGTQIAELQDIVKNNARLTSIDLNSSTIPNAFGLEPVNPNCLIYVPKGGCVTNTKNVVVSTSNSAEKFEIINNYECADLVIRDGYPFDAMYSFKALNASYDRLFKSNADGYMSTICLPFSARKDQVGADRIYAFSKRDDNGDLVFSEADSIKACVPYVIETNGAQPFFNMKNVYVLGTSPIASYWCYKGISEPDWTKSMKSVFHGTFSGMEKVKSDASQNLYGFQGGKFVYIGTSDNDGVDFKPFRAYFALKNDGNAAARELKTSGMVNGMEKIKAKDTTAKAKVYATDGTLIKSNADPASAGTLPAGIYIMGNKKVVVKH